MDDWESPFSSRFAGLWFIWQDWAWIFKNHRPMAKSDQFNLTYMLVLRCARRVASNSGSFKNTANYNINPTPYPYKCRTTRSFFLILLSGLGVSPIPQLIQINRLIWVWLQLSPYPNTFLTWCTIFIQYVKISSTLVQNFQFSPSTKVEPLY